jgi:WD40 repeat protein
MSADAPVTAVTFAGDLAMATTGAGEVLIETGQKITLHDGAILCACPSPDGKALITGGDDGRVCAISPDGAISVLMDARGKWINALASSAASGALVAAVSKEAIVFVDGVEKARHIHPSTVSAVALDAKGRRLAVAHYGGATLRYALVKDDPGVSLKWSGSHIGVIIAPDASYVVTAMQENGLHGWRVADKKDLRMAGYDMKTRSLSFDKSGKALATSGADCAVVWPFVGKDGPMGKPPALVAGRDHGVSTTVAFHPNTTVLAIGYSDGAVVLADIMSPPAKEWSAPSGAAITALTWSPDGKRLAAGDAAGNLIVAPA